MTVGIAGSGLIGATRVSFNGVIAPFTVHSDTAISAKVPAGATSGPIAVRTSDGTARSPVPFTVVPVEHVVVIDLENHSFDDMLGMFCVAQAAGRIVRAGVNDPCDGTNIGTLPGGSQYRLTPEVDYGLVVDHGVQDQRNAIDGGDMDGFTSIGGCTATSNPAYACLSQFRPNSGTCGASGVGSCIRNAIALSTHFAVSDRTFEFRSTPSWAGHMELASAKTGGFRGDTPLAEPPGTPPKAPGWGCDSGLVTARWDPASSAFVQVPSCIPDKSGSMGPIWDGTPYASGPHAPYLPTIFDRLDQRHIDWRIYGGAGDYTQTGSGWGWTICPTFFECLGSTQHLNLVANSQVVGDAQSGTLPGFSIVTPEVKQSEHQPQSVSVGDNWMGSVVSALMSGPEWTTTAVFITWDDCGCFFDHVNPLLYDRHWGVRVPMIIVSPYTRPGSTDSTPTTLLGPIAFAEHVFGLRPLSPNDAGAYDYMNSFDFSQRPLAPLAMTHTVIPRSTIRYVRTHGPSPNDPT